MKYTVTREFLHSEYTIVEANSEEEAQKIAIENDCWEENPNDSLLGYTYLVEKENETD